MCCGYSTKSTFLGLALCQWHIKSPTHILIDCCIHLMTCSPVLLGIIIHKSTLLMKPKPAVSYQCLDIAQIIVARNPSCVSIWNNGVLTTAHMCGPAPSSPCPLSAIGCCHCIHPCDPFESPYVDHTWCCMLCIVDTMLCTYGLGVTSQHKQRATMMSTMPL